MKQLLLRLAQRLAIEPPSADSHGCYHIFLEGHDLVLEPTGTQFTVRSVLPCALDLQGQEGLAAAQRALEMVTGWARRVPQAVVVDPQGQWVVEARVELAGLQYPRFERLLYAQVEALEALRPLFDMSPRRRHGGAMVCRP
ncbi:CesT family type III secretion system chaperone [Pseudomonas entomophila]|uniref:CesT family type III secretion system chaperone n=1 Tax=Pseudomonas entomophila TaxID=312306 RepID=UPI00240724CF|nr:CesT family type III secretion system chaperone [Pseudomonas entomophila]MDF9618779.1 CesT family type III secretion system chaperone [Pseudomonas entomophila]